MQRERKLILFHVSLETSYLVHKHFPRFVSVVVARDIQALFGYILGKDNDVPREVIYI